MNNKKCPVCGVRDCIRKGMQNGYQRWQCRQCRKKFQANRKAPPDTGELFCLYTFNKQTLAELAQLYHIRTKEVQRMIDGVVIPAKQHDPRPIALAVDTTFLGDLGVVVFRDQRRKKNLWWAFVESERLEYYADGRRMLESLGYAFVSVTADGLPGLSAVFSGIPFQFCHFHAKKNITKYLTKKPKTEAGIELRTLMNCIHIHTHQTFTKAIKEWEKKHRLFLKERTYHPSGHWSYTHRRLRSALRSMIRMSSYLFTYQQYDFFIPTTTNTLEGHFRHIKVRAGAHAGVSLYRKQKMIELLLLNSSATYTKDMHKRLF